MILRKIHLHPFGGIADLTRNFEPGLNVVKGANESGKSTLFRAIETVLFVSANLRKREFGRSIEPFIPLGGGDTVRVALDFTVDGSIYHLERSWGGTQSELLVLPNETSLTDEHNLRARLSEVLPATEGTFRSVLMAYQSGLADTVSSIKRKPETIEALADLLQRAVFETDGVSVERFRTSVQAEYNTHFKRWDRERKRPEDESSRYQRDVGHLLQAWYTVDDMRQECRKAESYDKRMDALNAQITSLDEDIDQKTQFIVETKPVVESVQQRKILESQLESTQTQLDIYEKDNEDWPVVEQKLKEIEEELPDLKKSVSQKEDQIAECRQIDRQTKTRERFEMLKGLKEAAESAEAVLAGGPTLKGEELAELQELDNKRIRLEAEISAATLSLRIVARKHLDLSIQEGIQDPEEHSLAEEEILDRVYKGKVRISHPDWDVELTSGDGSLDASIQGLQQTQEALSSALAARGLEDVEAARQANSDYSSNKRESTKARDEFEETLAEDVYADIEAQIEQMGDEPDLPSEVELLQELGPLQRDLDRKTVALREARARMEKLSTSYESKHDLFLKVGEIALRQSNLKTEIAELPPLPEGVDNPESLLSHYKETEADLKTLEEDRNSRVLDRKDLEKEEPEATTEELHDFLAKAKAAYCRSLRRGEAIGRVHDTTEALAAKLDKDTYKGLVGDLSRTVSAMTGGRYSEIPMEAGLPSGLRRDDGAILPEALLSAGTKDVLALSLRLAMARQFLAGAEGVLILDDPLVDMDPERQAMAVSALHELSEEKQVILFTCHPGHADQLGGNLIGLASGLPD